ncbi:multisubunit sodium/proton antiporter, MrpG subunit [Bellilinea caldifistulae]|uniref:monovalent cation/H(+) antiporter subunit G n=1 Tax=Bellilinea caldifistulae TaxID=360411 RepID=UPI000A96A7AD|nr:monovalent cation/H(+) antiporter subunit G [Bellilinea caldifistulae]GAP12152.1 multisubunit sodium/proton antiporter, MrpG subunit [Bellilinea caldifistulae]
MLREWIVAIVMILGAAFMLIASIGLLRMPDLFSRMSATSKAATLGAGLVMLAAALYFSESGITLRVLAIIVFLLLTVPVAAHMIGRAAYFDGVPLWKGTLIDDLRGHYRTSDHQLVRDAAESPEFAIPEGEEGDDFFN